MRFSRILFCGTFLLMIASFSFGCTTFVKSTKMGDLEESPRGVLYSLPMLQYEITLTRDIVSISGMDPEDSKPPEIDVQISAAAQESYVADPYSTFELDYTSLTSGTKVTSLDLEFFDNTCFIKSFNAIAEDRTGEIIANTFTIAANIALAGVGAPGLPLPAAEPKGFVLKSEVIDALAQLKKTEKSLRDSAKELKAAQKEVELCTLLVTASNQPTEDSVKNLQAATKKLDEKKRALENLEKARRPFLALVKHTEQIKWPESGNPKENIKPHEPSDKLRTLWFEAFDHEKHSVDDIISETEIKKKLTVYFALEPMVTELVCQQPGAGEDEGIFYRYPVPVRLKISRASEFDPSQKVEIQNASKKPIISQAPQFGPLVLLPFKNGLFENNTLQVTFASTGHPSKLTYKNLKAAAETATASLAGMAEQLPALRQQFENAELEKLKRETALLQQKKSLWDAQETLQPEATADLDAQTALLEAEIALEEAKARLAALNN